MKKFLSTFIILVLATAAAKAEDKPKSEDNDKKPAKCSVVLNKPTSSKSSADDEEDDDDYSESDYEGMGMFGGFGFGSYKPKTETPEEKAAREAKAAEAARLREIEKAALKSELKAKLAEKKSQNSEFLDRLQVLRLKKTLGQPLTRKTYSLLYGSPFEKLSDFKAGRAKYLAQFLVDQGNTVIFDADATTAQIIADVVGDHGIGISSGDTDITGFKNFVVIKNPYLRMASLSAGKHVAIEPTSPVGLAMVVEKEATNFYATPKPESESLDFKSWEPKGASYGLKFDKKLDWMAAAKGDGEKLIMLSNEELVEQLDTYDMKSLLNHEDIMLEGQAALTKDAKTSGFGAVVFGSGGIPYGYTQAVYKIVRALAEKGIAISTGGAGGVMEIANQAAFDAGADSIGIGMGGKLATEKKTMSDIQTRTVQVGGYEQRIPLLLYKKEIVVIAPGGGGTMKELAATLVQEGAGTANRMVVFIGRDYYGNMFRDFKKNLPATISRNYHIVDSVREMETLLEKYRKKVWTPEELKRVSNWVKPKPRNNNTEFELKPIITSPKDKDDISWYGM